MNHTMQSCGIKTELLPGMAMTKRDRNIRYLLSLKEENLLLPFRFEAGLYSLTTKKTDFHWGWDSPLSHIRGTFTGHWLSAAARLQVGTGHAPLKAMADRIVDEIRVCQQENGGRWAFPIPEKYLYRIRDGKHVWAPQYVCHKVMAGLLDMHLFAGNRKALDIILGCADWFLDFTADINREIMSDMMDLEETGGLMELWADLFAVTGDPRHLDLMRRYERPRLLEPIFRGEDVLTNLHANATIPEIQGAARAYEVTGEEKYRMMVENYWRLAIADRGTFVTGGQTSGEIWTPPGMQSSRLGSRNQEHCVVYNLMRLSQYLYRWTGDTRYADFWEQNLYNGIFAQGYWEEGTDFCTNEDHPPKRGHVAYYLPLEAGAVKRWGSETDHFWCCHCTLVQANATFHEAIFYQSDDIITVSQYLPARLRTEIGGKPILVTQESDPRTGESIKINDVDTRIWKRPESLAMKLSIEGGGKRFTVRFRLPWWLAGEATLHINGKSANEEAVVKDGYLNIQREWETDQVFLCLPKLIRSWPLADRQDTVAFIDGPVALAARLGEQRTLHGDPNHPETFLVPDNEREWVHWLPYWRTVNQPVNFRLVPLYEIGHEPYTVYFQTVHIISGI